MFWIGWIGNLVQRIDHGLGQLLFPLEDKPIFLCLEHHEGVKVHSYHTYGNSDGQGCLQT